MPKIVTVTLNPTVDISSDAETVRPVRKVRTRHERFDPGGGGVNVARVVSTLGGEAEAIYLAGGEIGDLLDRLLGERGVACRRVSIPGQTRIGYIVHEDSTGLEYRFVPEGPTITEADCNRCLDLLGASDADYVVCSGSLPAGAPPDIYVRMAQKAGAMGARFVLDSSGVGLRATLDRSKVFLVKPSLSELEQLSGRKLGPADAAGFAAKMVADGMAELVAVTMGSEGALLASSVGVETLPAIPVRVGSAVGAGDSFLGGVVWALGEGRTVAEAFRYGMAAGAAATITPGTELCRRDDLFDLHRRSYGG